MTGHTPYRRCVACGKRSPQGSLLRLYRGGDGALALTNGAPRTGRGSYCCPVEACRRKTLTKRLYAKKLGAARPNDEEQLLQQMQSLAAELEQRNGVAEYGENHR